MQCYLNDAHFPLHIQNSPIQNSPKNYEMKEKKQSHTKQSGLRSPVGALRSRHRLAAITGSKFCIKSYPQLASSQDVGATAAVTICSDFRYESNGRFVLGVGFFFFRQISTF